jgi:hypothetical protein
MSLRGERLPDSRQKVATVDAGQSERTRSHADLRLQNSEKHVHRRAGYCPFLANCRGEACFG